MPMNNAMQPNAQMDTPSNALARRPAPTNSLRRLPPNLGAYVQQKTGLEQWRNDERLNLLPRRTASGEWLAPALVNEFAKAALAPGYAMRGGQVTEEDALNFGLNFMGSGLGASAATKGVPRNALGMNAYHGSPHRFSKFDMSKVGTGEGAQAYGHGLYFAENPGVAQEYRSRLADRAPIERLKIGTKTVGEFNGFDYSPRGNSTRENIHSSMIEDVLIDENELVAQYNVGGDAAVQRLVLEKLDDRIKDYATEWPDGVAHAKALRDELSRPGAVTLKMGEQPGALYTVEIPDEAVAQMLDWDAPLSQQPESVRKALMSDKRLARLFESGKIDDHYQNGGEFYRALTGRFTQDQPPHLSGYAAENSSQTAASRHLRELGIPGIRYLDAGSRDAGNGTRNIVVFDENLPKIIKRE
jgi:hypothetical protein